MDLNMKGKVAIVTGGAKGIGEAIVRSFAAEGCKLAIVNRGEEPGNALVKELTEKGVDIINIPTELTEEDQCVNAVNQTIEKFGRIDFLVNNAGVNDGVKVTDKPQAFMDSLHLNLFHVFAMMHYSLDKLKESKGVIINVSSKVAETGQGNTCGYAASKGGMNSVTRDWAIDLGEFGIRVNAVVPAEVMTPQYEKWINSVEDSDALIKKISSTIPFENRFTTSEEIADMVVFLASERSSHTTGQIVYVDGGYTHLDRAVTHK